MMSNVPNTTNTVGMVADSRNSFHGQANTRMYDESEKAKTMRTRTQANPTASSWTNNANGVFSVGSPTPETKIPDNE